MATTKIWDVSAHVSKLLAYVANKNKTTMEIENGFDDEDLTHGILYVTRAKDLKSYAETR